MQRALCDVMGSGMAARWCRNLWGNHEPPGTNRHVLSRTGMSIRRVTFQESPRCLEIWSGGASTDCGEFEKVLHEGEHGAIEPLDLRVRGFDDVVFVRSMSTAAVTEAEMAGWQAERFAREHVAGPRARITRPEQRINPMTPVNRQLSPDERRVTGRAGWIVTASHPHFDIAIAALREMRLERGECFGCRHVRHQAQIEFRDGLVRKDCFAAGTSVAAHQALDVHGRPGHQSLECFQPV